MAGLQKDPSGNFHIAFRLGGRRFKRSLNTKSTKQAASLKTRLEDTLQLVETGRIAIPPGSDVPTFLLSEGKLQAKLTLNDVQLSKLCEQFFESGPMAEVEPSTVKMMEIHARHLRRIIGDSTWVSQIGTRVLQAYVDKRSNEPSRRGRRVAASTIKKELSTFRRIMKWGK